MADSRKLTCPRNKAHGTFAQGTKCTVCGYSVGYAGPVLLGERFTSKR